ncbi:hypothetical protein ACVWWN_001811 [Mycobacterium sp. URHB0021]
MTPEGIIMLGAPVLLWTAGGLAAYGAMGRLENHNSGGGGGCAGSGPCYRAGPSTKSTMAAATSRCIVSLRMSWRPPGNSLSCNGPICSA